MSLNGKHALPETDDYPSVLEVYWTETRNKIQSWLKGHSPSLAELYQTAVRLRFETKFPGRIRLASHCCREICNCLININIGQRKGKLEYSPRITEIIKVWETSGFSLEDPSLDSKINLPLDLPTSSPDINIPRKLYTEIAKLFKEHKDTSISIKKRAEQFLLGELYEEQGFQEYVSFLGDQWKQITDWFVSNAHDNGRIEEEYDENEFINNFDLLETILKKLSKSSKFYEITDELDRILEETNT